MEYTNKFVLVPADTGARFNSVENPDKVYAQAINDNLGQTLSKSNKSVEQQVRDYNQELSAYMFHKNILNQPIKFSITGEEEEGQLETSRPQNVLHAAVNFFQFNRDVALSAANLARFLNNVDGFDWNSRGEIIVKGKLIPNSNLTTLMNDILSHKYSVNPIGSDDLAELLIEANIPRQYVGERSGKYTRRQQRAPVAKHSRIRGRLNIGQDDAVESTSSGVRRRSSTLNQPTLFANAVASPGLFETSPEFASIFDDDSDDNTVKEAEHSYQGRGVNWKWTKY